MATKSEKKSITETKAAAPAKAASEPKTVTSAKAVSQPKAAVPAKAASEPKTAAPVKEVSESKKAPAGEAIEPKKTEEAKKETAPKETAPKKTAPKKTAPAKKKEITTSVVVEYYGKSIDVKDTIPEIKQIWRKAGNKVRDIKDIKFYAKPEDGKIYFVVNGGFSGSVDF